jgi:hypothetical protein
MQLAAYPRAGWFPRKHLLGDSESLSRSSRPYRTRAYDTQDFVIIPYRGIPFAGDTRGPSVPSSGYCDVLPDQTVALNKERAGLDLRDDIGGGR